MTLEVLSVQANICRLIRLIQVLKHLILQKAISSYEIIQVLKHIHDEMVLHLVSLF